MNWLTLNLLLAAPFVIIWVGVPFWLVLKHPDEDAHPRATGDCQPRTVTGPAQQPPHPARRLAPHNGPRVRQA
jgi:hypothetical protein